MDILLLFGYWDFIYHLFLKLTSTPINLHFGGVLCPCTFPIRSSIEIKVYRQSGRCNQELSSCFNQFRSSGFIIIIEVGTSDYHWSFNVLKVFNMIIES